jgi:hypothetical protein
MKPYRTGYYYFMGEKVFVLRDYFDGLYFMWDGEKRLEIGDGKKLKETKN